MRSQGPQVSFLEWDRDRELSDLASNEKQKR